MLRAQRHVSAFTFIEILAVLFIIGLISSVMFIGLRTHSSAQQQAQDDWLTVYRFDQDLRQAAPVHAPITVYQQGLRLRATGTNFTQEIKLAPGTRFQDHNGKILRSWIYDQYGTSMDLHLITPQQRFMIYGLSGLSNMHAQAQTQTQTQAQAKSEIETASVR